MQVDVKLPHTMLNKVCVYESEVLDSDGPVLHG